jgi:hypothetical protein
MQHEIATTRASLAGVSAAVKCPTRVITYAWGEKYVDALLTLTLPALLAPGNLPYVASEVPCELVILTQRRFSRNSIVIQRSLVFEVFAPFDSSDSMI